MVGILRRLGDVSYLLAIFVAVAAGAGQSGLFPLAVILALVGYVLRGSPFSGRRADDV